MPSLPNRSADKPDILESLKKHQEKKTKMKPRGIRCLKFFLTVLNLIIIVFGLVLMALCIANMREKKSRPEEQSYLSKGIFAFLLTLCLCLVVTGVLGCIGALREHVRVLYVHSCFFIFLVTVELVVGVGGAVISAWTGGGSEMPAQFYRNSTDEIELSKHYAYWDKIQSENQCCGVDGPLDYAILHRDIPPSCCVRAHPLREGGARRQLHATCLSDQTFYNRGCVHVLRMKKAVKGKIFVITGIILTCLEVHCVGLATWLAKTIRRERRKLQSNLEGHYES